MQKKQPVIAYAFGIYIALFVFSLFHQLVF